MGYFLKGIVSRFGKHSRLHCVDEIRWYIIEDLRLKKTLSVPEGNGFAVLQPIPVQKEGKEPQPETTKISTNANTQHTRCTNTEDQRPTMSWPGLLPQASAGCLATSC